MDGRFRFWTADRTYFVVRRAGMFAPGASDRVLDAKRACNVLHNWLRDDVTRRQLRRLAGDPLGLGVTNLHQHDDRALATRLRRAFEHGDLVMLELPHAPIPAADWAEEPLAAKPATSTPEATKKTWFEVTVVDVYGGPVAGAELAFSGGSEKETFVTNVAGIARWNGAETSFATARIQNLPALRETLKSRWAKGKKTKAPEGPSTTKQSVMDDDVSIPVESEVPATLVLFKPLVRVRLIGMHFDTNKCFLRPSAMKGIKHVAAIYAKTPKGQLLVVGHTDTTADDAYNLDLSVERAEAVKAYLKDDVPAWEAWFAEGKPKQKRWGSVEITLMISALPCEQNVAGFQAWSNATRGTDLKVDGVVGPKTRKALIEAYMALDGTTLPKSIEAVVHGCGEFFPRTDEGDAYGKDGVAAEENRRVEIFCFDDEILPPAPGSKATKSEPEYQEWMKQVTDTLDSESDPSGDIGKIWMELWDKLGEERLAGVAYEIVGDNGFSGTTDAAGRLVHSPVQRGQYSIKVDGRSEDSAALVLAFEDVEPQIRFLH